jgi:phage repressor protein C with HTH and peptisase S24 domain
MAENWRARLIDRMKKLGYNEKTLAEKAGLGTTAVHDMLKRSKKAPRIDTVQAIGNALGMSLAELLEGQTRPPVRVPIIGELAEGEVWRQYQTGRKLPETLDLPTAEQDLISVKILGNSMAPRYQQGDVLLGSRVFGNHADNYIGLPMIVKTQDHGTYVKVLTRGSSDGKYTLRSYDPAIADIPDVTLVWFAPIVAILPQSI